MSRNKSSPRRRILLILAGAILLAGVGYFVYVYFQVHNVIPAGNARFTSSYVRAIAGIEEGTHILRVNEEQIRQNIQNAEPYLQVTDVRLQIPDTVVIEVEERRPAAYLPYENQYLLIDINTDILEILESDAMLQCPVVEGISVTEPEIGQLIVTQDAFKIAIMQEILQDLDQRNLFPMIATVDLTNINNIRLESRDGLAIRIGQAERIGDKIKWIQNRLPALSGQSAGLLDVSSGSFATYTMYDGQQQAYEPQIQDVPDSVASASPQATESGGPQSSSSSTSAPSATVRQTEPEAGWTVYGSDSRVDS